MAAECAGGLPPPLLGRPTEQQQRMRREQARRRCKQVLRPLVLALALAACVALRSGSGGPAFRAGAVDGGSGSKKGAAAAAWGQPRRALLNEEEEEGPVWEQCGFEADHLPGLFVVGYGVLVFWLFLGIAILCDDFFVPSLEAISEALNLSEDVAGATFMAAGSSAPELFTSFAGVAVDSDVGVGTIVGSAVFNILVIVALSGAFAGRILSLDWRILVRDSTFYAMSLILFTIFSWDGFFTAAESVVLLLMYALYLVIMKFNSRIMDRWTGAHRVHPRTVPPAADIEAAAGSPNESVGEPRSKSTPRDTEKASNLKASQRLSVSAEDLAGFPGVKPPTTMPKVRRGQSIPDLSTAGMLAVPAAEPRQFHHRRIGEMASALGASNLSLHDSHASIPGDPDCAQGGPLAGDGAIRTQPQAGEAGGTAPLVSGEDEEERDTTWQQRCCLPCAESPFPKRPGPASSSLAWAGHYGKCFLAALAFPYVWLYINTIPYPRRLYKTAFAVSIFWIAVLSFLMVTLVVRIGCIVGVDDYIMGLVVVAAGTSIPDALSSILVARDGYGDMAVSNAIGSNVFDINLGLGAPFLIKILIQGNGIDLLSERDRALLNNNDLSMTDHSKFGLVLLGLLVLIMAAFAGSKFRLTPTLGAVLFSLYLVFIAYALIQELYCKQRGFEC